MTYKNYTNLAVMVCLGSAFQGCSTYGELGEIGAGPNLSQIENPTLLPNYQPVSMPMPHPKPHVHKINSLWEDGAKAFFKDQRAHRVGDILTVDVQFQSEKVEMTSKPDYKKINNSTANLSKLFGLESKLQSALPVGADITNLVNGASKVTVKNEGTYKREDTFKFKIAAVVSEILPNGNLVISGHQEVRYGEEVRIIHLTGIVRREDVTSANRIDAKYIQNLRILHDSNGEFKDLTTLPWGMKAINKLSPF